MQYRGVHNNWISLLSWWWSAM